MSWLRWLKTETGNRLVAYGVLAVTIGIMISVVASSITAGGYLSAWDAGGHLLKAQYFAHHILPTGHLTGWFPNWHGGFDLFQFYPPLLYYVLGGLTYLFKPEVALRLTMAALWIGLVPVTYYFLRSFRLKRIIAALGTSFLLALNASFGIGLGALYGVGLLPNGLGFILAIWTLGRLKRDLSRPDRSPRQLLLTGLAFGLLILSHTFSAYWFVAASLILLATETIGRSEISWIIRRYGVMLGVGLLISAYWWVPLFLGIDQMGPTGAIQQSPTGAILSGLLLAKDSGGIVMALLAAAGVAYLTLRHRYRTLGFFGGLLIFSLLLSVNAINSLLPFSSVIASSQYIRFQAFAAWLILALGAFGLGGIWALCRKIKLPFVPGTLLASVVLVIFTQVVWPTLNVKRGFINVVNNPPTDDLGKVAGYLNANLKTGQFILTEFNWDARFYYGSPHFLNQRLPMEVPDAWDLDGNFPEGTLGASKAVLVASVLEQVPYLESQEDYLRGRGVRYVITTHPATRLKLAAVPWLREVFVGRSMQVFELTGYDRPFGLPATAAAQLAGVDYRDPGLYALRFNQPVDLPAATSLAVSYHPWLKARADGKPIPTRADVDHQLQLTQASTGISRLTLTYQPPFAARLPIAFSGLIFLAVVILLVRPDWLDFLRPRRVRLPGRRQGRTGPARKPRRLSDSKPRRRS